MQTPTTFLTIIVSLSLTVAGFSAMAAKHDFSKDPGWEGSANKESGRDYGYSSGNHVKDSAAGEVGGTFVRSSSASYYADTKVGPFTPKDALSFEGKITIAENRNFDGGVRVGFFDKGEVRNFIGFEILEPGGMANTAPNCRVQMMIMDVDKHGFQTDNGTPEWVLEPGKSYHFSFKYVPAPEWQGTIALTIKGIDNDYDKTFSYELTGGEGLADNITYNAFGFVTSPMSDMENVAIDIFVDDVSYGSGK